MQWNRESWSRVDYIELVEYLQDSAEEGYAKFTKNLIPNYPHIYGIRTPKLRLIAKEIAKGNYQEYLQLTKNYYHEEILLEGMVIGYIKGDYVKMREYMPYYLGKADNWALIDSFTSGLKSIKKDLNTAWGDVETYSCSTNSWQVRYSLVAMLCYYTDEIYLSQVLNILDSIGVDDYYVKMAQAWLVAKLYTVHGKLLDSYLLDNKLDRWTHNKAIQKITETLTVLVEDKDRVRQYKR